ncbi:MAG: MarR family winged helix-turn-helix transcriptional regulator [Cytophagales bacterium]
MSNLKNTIGSLIGQTGRLIGNLLDSNFRKNGLDITPEQWIILVNLFEKDGLSQKELAAKCHKNKASITSVITNLENKKYIQRVQNETDKRLNSIRLTDLGVSLREPLFAIAKQNIEDFTAGISTADIETCNSVLKKIIENVHQNISLNSN